MLFVLQLELLISDLPRVDTFKSFRSLPDITSQERTSLSTQLKYCPFPSQTTLLSPPPRGQLLST